MLKRMNLRKIEANLCHSAMAQGMEYAQVFAD
jgi:hypothetical protein